MSTYNKKCIGCGNFLNNEENNLGFVPKLDLNTSLCQRCFKLKHYNEFLDSKITTPHIQKILSNLNISNSNVFLVLDVLDIPNTILNKEIINNAKKLFFIVNKIDKLPNIFNHFTTNKNVKQTINSFGFNNYEIIYTSIKNNSSIKRLMKIINSINKNENIHFIGKSNTGKTSLINCLLKLNKKNTTLISNSYINTTLDFKKIQINKTHNIIDSPGFIDNTNILNFINPIKSKLINSNNNVVKNFSLNTGQSIIIEKLAVINYLDGEKCNFSFYIAKNMKLLRCKSSNFKSNIYNNEILVNIEYENEVEWKEMTFILKNNRKYNLSINGLCSISIGSQGNKISVLIHPDVEVKLNEFAII